MPMIKLSDNTRYVKVDNKWFKYHSQSETRENGFNINNSLLNYFSVSVGELRDSEDNSVLVYPSSFQDAADEIEKQIVFDITKRDADGNPIEFWTRNTIGFISHKGHEVSIGSRFSQGKEDNFLYYMLARVCGINLLNLELSAQSKKQGLNLMVFLLPKLLKEALSQGLFKQYIYKEYNDANIRGPIDINRHLRRNIPFNGRVAYRTREFSYDNPVTQLVRHAIELIKTSQWGLKIINNDELTKSFSQQIITATPTYEDRQKQDVINANLRPVSHPFYTAWQPLQDFCLRLLCNESLSYGKDKHNKVHGMLIDAAWLWEEYLACVLAEKTGFMHHTSDNALQLFDKGEGTFQTVIPDYLDAKNNLVADAKYIPLHRFDRLDAERAAAVYYKTIMYMYRFNATKGFLFHPCNNADIEYIKKQQAGSPSRLSHLNIDEENMQIFADYKIIDTAGCLHELGMIIPDADDYGEFCENMKIVEHSYNEKIMELTK